MKNEVINNMHQYEGRIYTKQNVEGRGGICKYDIPVGTIITLLAKEFGENSKHTVKE